MVAKPTPDEVKVIIATSLPDASIQVFIDDAALIADQCAMIATYSTELQKAIVRYLAAHLMASTARAGVPGQLTSKSLGDASESYASGQLGADIASTGYGKQAIALDPSGCLERVGKMKVKLFNVGGDFGGPRQGV